MNFNFGNLWFSQYLNDSKKNLLLAPDEIAKLLNKHTLSKVLSSPRKAIDAEEYVLKREKEQDDAVREGLKVCDIYILIKYNI